MVSFTKYETFSNHELIPTLIYFFHSEFRECFYLFARSGQINNLDELTVNISHF